MRLPSLSAVLAASWLLATIARASPNLPADDPAWDAFRDAIAMGKTADPLGGVQWLSRSRVSPALSFDLNVRVPEWSGARLYSLGMRGALIWKP